MKITTIQGNKSTTPRGTEIAELPFNRRGRLKNASLDEVLLLFLISFIVGRSVPDGKRFIARRTTSISARHLYRVKTSQTEERTRRNISGCYIIRRWTFTPGLYYNRRIHRLGRTGNGRASDVESSAVVAGGITARNEWLKGNNNPYVGC
jgi:hypothetical protein